MTNFKFAMFATAVALSAQAGAQDQPLALNLVCGGGGNANSASVATIHSWDSDGNTGGATLTGRSTVGFEDEVAVQIAGSDGKLRMPRSMLPPFHGGDNGWFTLKNIAVTPSEITATVSVNPINRPKVRIDRYTGAISISGKAGNYAGRCRAYDPATAQRQF